MNTKNIKILLVDDEPDIIEFLSFNLKNEGYTIFTANNGIEAIEIATQNKPHLILLDLMMPNMDGIETCEKIRTIKELSHTVIAFLTARGEDYSQVAAYQSGADDYIIKPIRPKLLVHKIISLLRRSQQRKNINASQIIDTGKIIIDKNKYAVFISGTEISLSKKEFELLSLLASEPNKVFKRDFILDNVWGNEITVIDRTLDVHIRKLRAKIGNQYIKTLKGVGYKYTP